MSSSFKNRRTGAQALLGALAHATTAELEALNALLVPLRAHATRAADGSHDGFAITRVGVGVGVCV